MDKSFYIVAKFALVMSMITTVVLWMTGQVPFERLIAVLGLALATADYINGVRKQ